MNENSPTNPEKLPRADTLTVENDHNKYALHPLAFEYETLPSRLVNYHEGRIINGEEMDGYFDDFIPVAHDSDRGQVLKKKVTEETIHCPDCEVVARKSNDRGEPYCPECGLICNTKGPSVEVLADARAAGRMKPGAGGSN